MAKRLTVKTVALPLRERVGVRGYAKNEMEDLPEREKKLLAALIKEIVEQE